MELSPLTAVNPVDGRYYEKTSELAEFFSEYALFKYRVFVEIEYFIALTEIPLKGLENFDEGLIPQLQSIYKTFSEEDARAIKDIEKVTNHDVKAVFHQREI
jgi:adenylosuccinate lyase